MKTHRKCEGSALLITILVVFVLSLIVASSLKTVTNEYKFTMFSTTWSQAMQTAEAGLEVAFAAFNDHIDTRTGFDSWTHDGNETYSLSYASLAPAGHSGHSSEFTVSANTNTWTITATGKLDEPGSTNTLTRTVQVVLEPDYFQKWEHGMLGNTIFFNGSVDCDSYDSTLGPYGGANVSDGCDIGAITEAVSGIVGVGGPTVAGDVYVTESGSADGAFWTGDVHNDFEAEIPTYFPERTDITDGELRGGDSVVVAGEQYMGVPAIDAKGSTKAVTFSGEGEITVYVEGDVEFGTAETLSISPDPGKNLTVIIIINGIGEFLGTMNTTTDPLNLQIYGTQNCTSIKCVANNPHHLTIYAPQAYVDMGGNAELYGSIVGSYVEVSGTFDFHYDESLSTNSEPLLVQVEMKSWREL